MSSARLARGTRRQRHRGREAGLVVELNHGCCACLRRKRRPRRRCYAWNAWISFCSGCLCSIARPRGCSSSLSLSTLIVSSCFSQCNCQTPCVVFQWNIILVLDFRFVEYILFPFNFSSEWLFRPKLNFFRLAVVVTQACTKPSGEISSFVSLYLSNHENIFVETLLLNVSLCRSCHVWTLKKSRFCCLSSTISRHLSSTIKTNVAIVSSLPCPQAQRNFLFCSALTLLSSVRRHCHTRGFILRICLSSPLKWTINEGGPVVYRNGWAFYTLEHALGYTAAHFLFWLAGIRADILVSFIA